MVNKKLTDVHFNHAVNFVLSNEGGYSNDPEDSGGKTKFGISQRSYPNVNLDTLTIEQAKKIYKKDFWDSQLYKNINNLNVVTKIFDLAVNMGAKWAHRLVQRALRAVETKNVFEDGILGPITLNAINNAKPNELLAALKSEAAGHYRIIATINQKQKKFLKGWLNRAYK